MDDPVRLVRDIAKSPVGEVRWPGWATLVPFSAVLALKAHALMIDCYRNGYGAISDDFDTWWSATRHDSEFDASLCFCVMRDARLVAFEHCWNSGFIKDLAVSPRMRNQGLGEALLRHALAAFKTRGFTEVALKVRVGNGAAQRLYRRVGFTEG
jgi:ribosomal protein S18 acetylase RimI-like enzyme